MSPIKRKWILQEHFEDARLLRSKLNVRSPKASHAPAVKYHAPSFKKIESHEQVKKGVIVQTLLMQRTPSVVAKKELQAATHIEKTFLTRDESANLIDQPLMNLPDDLPLKMVSQRSQLATTLSSPKISPFKKQ